MIKTFKKTCRTAINISLSPFILKDYFIFRSKNTSRFSLRVRDLYPQIRDKTITTNFDTHYVYHTSWAARIVAQTKPSEHIDISSILYFCGIVSAFVPVRFYDYRPAKLNLTNLNSKHADLLKLPFANNSISSLSCMHTIEHIGLGRYGEPIDPDADLKAVNELIRVLAPGGTLIFVTPVGKPRIQFNAHRIYAYDQICEYFKDLNLKEFSLIPDNALEIGMINNATKEQADSQKYGCGCFWFIKK